MSELLQNFINNREKLDTALRNGLLLTNSHSDRVGLINQGATCYLNSLLQCLFYNLSFRVLILQAKPDSAILVALQELFATLQLSSSPAVNTKDLVTAFGWSRGQVFEQHDVHELFSLLLDALGESSTALGTQLPDLFQGSISDVLLCPTCDNRRENISAFLNISLDLSIPDKALNVTEAPPRLSQPNVDVISGSSLATQQSVELSALLRLHMQIETLDPDNMWHCSGCSDKVQALKYHEYTVLPKSLMIHFKRFRYNTVLRKREKVKLPVYFPCLLDTKVLAHPVRRTCAGSHVESSNVSTKETISLDTDDEDGKCNISSAGGDLYRLHSILLHTGTANGGHYKAYVLDSLSGHWLECNDASVSEMTSTEEASLFLQKESISSSMLGSFGTKNIEGDSFNKSHDEGVVGDSNIRGVRNRDTGALTHGEDGIAPSSAAPTAESLKSDRECIGDRGRPKKIAFLSDEVLRENAYMLLYQKISKDCMKEISKTVQNNEELKYSSCGERKEAIVLSEACLAAIPMPLQIDIISKNKELTELRSLYEMQKKILHVKIFYNFTTVEAVKRLHFTEHKGGTNLSTVSTSITTERVLIDEVKLKNRNMRKKNQLENVTLAVLMTDTMDNLLTQVCLLLEIFTTPTILSSPLSTSSLSNLNYGTTQEVRQSYDKCRANQILPHGSDSIKREGNIIEVEEEGVEAGPMGIASTDVKEGLSIYSGKYLHRLRAYDPVTGQDGETFGSRGAESLEKLGFRVCPPNRSAAQACVTLKLESRREDHLPFCEMSKNDLCVDVIVWSTEVSAAYTICYESTSSHPHFGRNQATSSNHSTWNNRTGSLSDENIIIDANDDVEYGTNASEGEDFTAINSDQTSESHASDILHKSEAVLTAAAHTVLVPGELDATLGGLRSTVAKLLNISVSDLILIFNNGRSLCELENGRDGQTLGRAFGIKKGDTVFAEIKIKPSITDANTMCHSGDDILSSDFTHAPFTDEYVSQALSYLRNLSTSITIKFNDPRIYATKAASDSNFNSDGTVMSGHLNLVETEDSIPNDYLTLKTSSDTLLKDVKILIASVLGISVPKTSQAQNGERQEVEKREVDEEGTNDFYMAKSSSAFASQYNDFSISLSDLGLFDQSVIYLQMGKGCLQGEHILRFEVETKLDSAVYGTSISTTTSLSSDIPINLLTSTPVAVHVSDPSCEFKFSHLVADSQSASASSCDSVVSIKSLASNGSTSISKATSSDTSSVIGLESEKDGKKVNITRIVPLGQMIVQEQSSVIKLKERLLSSWDSFQSENPLPIKPLSVHHIRLRDGKSGNSLTLGTLLRNERILSKCLLGLTSGRRIVVQILSVPEIIRTADWVLTVQLVTYSSFLRLHSPPVSHISTLTPGHSIDDTEDIMEKTSNDSERSLEEKEKHLSPSLVVKQDLTVTSEFTVKKVHRPSDIPISRAATIKDLYRVILNLYPHLRETYHNPIASSDYPELSVCVPVTTGASNVRVDSTSTNDSDVNIEKEKDNVPDPLILSGEGEISFPEKDYLSVAKGFSTGPPLSLKSSLKLSWDPSVITASPDLRIDHPSLGLRDGSLLVIRGGADWQRALTEYAIEGNSVTLPSEAEKVPENPTKSYLPPWKSKSTTLLKKSSKSLSTAVHRSSLSNSSMNSVGVRSLLNSGGEKRVEKSLSLRAHGGQIPSTGISRQGILIQSALELDCKVNQNTESMSLDANSETDGNIVAESHLPSHLTSQTVRRSISDSDVVSGAVGIELDRTSFQSLSRPSSRHSFSTLSSSSGAGVATGAGAGRRTKPDRCVASKELRIPVAPIKMVRALKKGVEGAST